MIQKTLATLAGALLLQTAAVAQENIKLGLVSIDGGPFVTLASYMKDGTTFAVEQLNARGGALGRKYELVMQNHAGSPSAAIQAATRLVQQQRVSFFTGLNPSSTALAIQSKLPQLNALFLDSTASADELTGKNCHANYFRIAANDLTTMNSFREMLKESGTREWDILAADYASGHSFAERFSRLVKEQGGKVNQTVFAPMNAPDLGSYISQLLSKPARGLAVLYPGSGAIALGKQQQPFGLFGKYDTVLSASTTNETLIDAQADTTAGLWTSQTYFATVPGERNAQFVQAFEQRFKRKPTYIDFDAYTAFEVLHAGIVKAGSTDVAAVRQAMRDLKMQTVMGEVQMRGADHQLLRPLAVVQAVQAAPGKGALVLKSVLPADRLTPPVSPECKMAAGA